MHSPFEKNLPNGGQSMHPSDGYLMHQPPSKRGFIALIAGLVSTACLTLFLAWIGIQQYNEVQELNERVGTNLDHVVNQYMRRADLIPKLNRAIESFSSNEKALIDAINKSQSLMDKVTKGASPAANVELMDAFIKTQRDIDLAIGQLIASFRSKNASSSSDLYMGLMVQLEGTENRIAFARSNYIEAISRYNVSLKVFPMQFFTKQLGFEPKVNYFKDYVSLLNAPS